MNAGKTIVLTGLDGAGKDFVARRLHERDPGSLLIATPTEPFRCARAEIDAAAEANPAMHYHFYLASVIHASSIIGKYPTDENVYVVRYLLDTVAYHRALGLAVELAYETPNYEIRRPDTTIFLEVAEPNRQRRLAARDRYTVGDELTLDYSFRHRLEAEYESHSDFFTKVNNSDRDLDVVVEEIRDIARLS